MAFLPTTKKEMDERKWDALDFLFINGDAYIDHPSFGHAVITRLLENEGFRVGIISQPDWKSINDFVVMGRPKYAVLISSGVIDSMVNHYTVNKKKRNKDVYTPGGKSGKRPDRAVTVYSNRVREAFKGITVIIGGIEASLRRFAHYDYWENRIRRSILADSGADLLIYGMGEKPLLDMCRLIKQGAPIESLKHLKGTAYASSTIPENTKGSQIIMPSHKQVSKDKKSYAKAFKIQYENQAMECKNMLVQSNGSIYVVQNPQAEPLTTSEMDRIYALPFERNYHPKYIKTGGVPALKEVKFSITSHRGCPGACAFCALTFHQGRITQKRSQESILAEAQKLAKLQDFKGYIHDIGGPTANFRNVSCAVNKDKNSCGKRYCLHPDACGSLIVDHSEYLELLRKVRALPGIKKVFIRSGIRYDYIMLDKNDEFFNELCEYHISGQLKVAPEHVADRVLKMMNKPSKKIYDRFVKKFYEINQRLGKEQYLVPYLISSHPGSDLKAAVEMAEYLRDIHHTPEQVQDFYPTPGTLSTCMFYTGLDPLTMRGVHVPKNREEKAMQRALLQYRKRENRKLVIKALKKAGREDLIGFGSKCLVKSQGSNPKRQSIKKSVGRIKNGNKRNARNRPDRQ